MLLLYKYITFVYNLRMFVSKYYGFVKSSLY